MAIDVKSPMSSGDKSLESQDLDFLAEGNDDGKKTDDKKEKTKSLDEEEKEDEEKLEEELNDDGDEDDEDKDESDDDEKEEDKKTDDNEDEDNNKEGKSLRFSDIKKVYPEFFKKFPEFKGVVAREFEYGKAFATPEEAIEARDTVDRFNNISTTIFSGKSDAFLKDLQEANGPGFKKFVDNFLPALYSVDDKSYIKITTPIIQNIIRETYLHGKKSGNDNAMNAALVMHMEVFGTDKEDVEKAIAQEIKFGDKEESKEEDPERKKLQSERDELLNSRANDAFQSLKKVVDPEMTTEITKGINPAWSNYEKKNFLRDCFEELDRQLSKDEVHMKRMKSLWERERADGYKGRNADSLKDAVLSRAKALLPSIRVKIKSEMRGIETKDNKDEKNRSQNRHVPSGKDARGNSASRVNSSTNPKNIDYSKSSDMDILMDGVEGKSTVQMRNRR